MGLFFSLKLRIEKIFWKGKYENMVKPQTKKGAQQPLPNHCLMMVKVGVCTPTTKIGVK